MLVEIIPMTKKKFPIWEKIEAALEQFDAGFSATRSKMTTRS